MKIIISLLLVSTYLFSEEVELETSESKEPFQEHISLVVHENLINDFFSNMGQIKGEGTSSIVDYSWYLLNPRIEIDSTGGSFHGKVRAKGSNFRVTRDIVGSVNITYDKEVNKLYVEIDKADVILDVDIFGKNIVLGKLDIAKHFTKSLKLDGPQGVANDIEFKLPSGEAKKMNVEVISYDLSLIKDAIKISTSLGFTAVDLNSSKWY